MKTSNLSIIIDFSKTLLFSLVIAFTIVFTAEAFKAVVKGTKSGYINWHSRY